MKTKKITLTHGQDGPRKKYRVEQIENSLAYAPHQMLTESEVQGLCSNTNWHVVIKPMKDLWTAEELGLLGTKSA